MFKKGKNSKTPRILQLRAEGISMGSIAKIVGCTEANVWSAIQREKKRVGQVKARRPWEMRWRGYVANLREDHVKWLEAEARRIGTAPSDIARALLIDALDEEIEKAAAGATA